MKAHSEAMELNLEQWRRGLVPWRMYSSDEIDFLSIFFLSSRTGGTSMKVRPLFSGQRAEQILTK